MKNVIKKVLTALALGLVLVNTAVAPLHANASSDVLVGSYDPNGNVKGQAGILMKVDLTKEDLDYLGKDFLKEIKKTDHWEQTKTGLQKFYPAQPHSLEINGENIAIVGDGEFSISDDSEELDIIFQANGQELKTTAKNDKDLNTLDIIKTVDFDDFMHDMNPNEEEGTIGIMSEIGEKQYPGDYVHCNRFNGVYSDNVYYSHSSAKGLRNFIRSDCDYAFISYNCAKDYTSSTNCRGLQSKYNYTNCSKALGHTQRYHWFDN